MSTDTIQRSIFKMNPDFWHQRTPPNNGIQNLSMTSPDSNLGSHQSSAEDVKYSQMKEFSEMKEFSDIKNYTQKFDDFKAYTEKIYTQQEKYNSHADKFDKYANGQEMGDAEKGGQPRSTPGETAQNLTSEGFKSSEAFPQNSYKPPGRTAPNTPDMSPPAASLLQNLSTEQLRNIQSTLASFGQTNDVRNIQANAIQNLSTHIQNVLPPNALSPNEIRNLQSLAISNLSTQVQSMTNANLNMGDIRNLTTIAVQNLTNHIENLRNQSANLTPNEVRNLTTVAVNNLTNHIQNLNQMNQPIPSGISANELPRNLAAFQQLANPVQTNLDIRNFTNNLSAMQNLTSLSGMSNNIAAVSAVLSAAAAQQAALSSQNSNQSAQNSENPQPEGVEPEISNGSNSASAANNSAGGGGGGSSTAGAAQGAANNAASNVLVPPGSGSNSNTEKGNSNDLPSRSNSAISNQTLEECWSTLQRVSWHLMKQCVEYSSLFPYNVMFFYLFRFTCVCLSCMAAPPYPPTPCLPEDEQRRRPPGDAWTRLASLVNLLEKLEHRKTALTTSQAEGYEVVRLPEDALLAGFTPLMLSEQNQVYTSSQNDMELAQCCWRIMKILFVGTVFLCGMEPPVLKLQKYDTHSEIVSVVDCNGHSQSSPTEDQSDTELMLESFSEEECEDQQNTNEEKAKTEPPLSLDSLEMATSPSAVETRRLLIRKEELEKKQKRQERHRKRVQAILQQSGLSVVIEVKPKYLVPDTNCFIDYLDLLQKIAACYAPGMEPYYILTIPLIVLNELEGLARGGRDRDLSHLSLPEQEHAADVSESARAALTYLRSRTLPTIRCVTTRGKFINSFTTFMVEDDIDRDLKNDDRVLATCISLCRNSGKEQTKPGDPRHLVRDVVLLTEDRNLRVKALARDVPVREVPDFAQWAGLG